MYEGGIREPLLVRWPGVVKAESVLRAPVSSPDFFPTLLEAAGAKPQTGQVLDGVSLVSLLEGGTLPERALFWHYPHYGNQGGAPSAAIRRGDWKLIEWQEDRRVELFNLAQDLGEKRDLAAQEPQRVAQLRDQLHAWQKQVGAQFPTRNANYDPDKASGRSASRPQQ
jgi:arylsulfatase A-like enzyme